MSKYPFKSNQRFAVYKAFDGRCQWCHEPVDFKTFHVDHVLPEELLNEKARLNSVLNTFSLPQDFNINDYENWIPAHSYCNLGKSDKVYEGAPFIRTILDKCIKNKPSMQAIEIKLNREPQKVEIFTKVEAAININLLNLKELQDFILKTDIMEADDKELAEIARKLAESIEYENIRRVNDLFTMVRDQTSDVLKKMSQDLGNDWSYSYRMAPTYKLGNPISWSLYNKVSDSLTVSCTIYTVFVNGILGITIEDEEHRMKTVNYKVTDGIDWAIFRQALKDVYKSGLKAKLG